MSDSESSIKGLVKQFFAAPALDFWHGYAACLTTGVRGLVLVFVGLAAGWWLYVPLHELLHAAGCLATGGTVTELEIDGLYGGGLLAKIFPFVTSGSEYAGRLSGFDTGGSDFVYLATVLAPFLLTIFPGVWALRQASIAQNALAFGFWLPFALGPFLSLTGDAYEIGSILVTRFPPWSGIEILRSDDIFLLAEQLAATTSAPWGGFVLAALVGVLWAFTTYALGALLSSSISD